jgi:uncharacterized repeat protein (TIGR01451 family)
VAVAITTTAALCSLPALANAATMITVTSTADSGSGSLRAAVVAANSGDTVFLPASPSHYTVSSGEITIAKAITIQGAGASSSVVDAGGTSRVFHVTSGVPSAATVTFQDLTITGGTTTSSPGGGGVLADHGNLVFTGVAVSGNAANVTGTANDGGGGIYDNDQNITLTNSTVSGNTASVTGNPTSANSGGGGIYQNGHDITLTNSTVSGNTASATGSSVSRVGGGGIYQDGFQTTLTNSAVSHNMASVTGSSGDVAGGGGIINDGSAVLLNGTTIDHNTANVASVASASRSGGGGVLDNGAGPVYVNSTISDNTTNALASPTNGGGGVATENVTMWQATNTTIAGNSASAATGGGVMDSDSALKFKSSMIAQNSSGAGGANCAGAGATTLSSQGYNLADDVANSCQFTAPTDIITATPGLGPLADNGGSTQTRALLAGSAAIDKIPLASCTDQSSPTPLAVATDQRGVPRPQPAGGNCDIGAYEVGNADLALTASASPPALIVGQHSTLSFRLTNAGPAPATNATLKVTLPPGLAFVSGSPSQGSCAAGAPGATCALGTIAAGGSVRVTIVVAAGAAGSLTASGTATASETDPTPSDNTASVTVSASPPGGTGGATPPNVTNATQSNTRWRRGDQLARFTKTRKKTPIGTRFSFTLNQPASVSFDFTQQLRGRKVKGKCVAQNKKNRKQPACKRTVSQGTLGFNAHAGVNTVSFQGRISASKKLKLGRYTLVIRATNAAGQRSAPRSLSFTIVK